MKRKIIIQNKNKIGLFLICLILLIAVVLIINYTVFNEKPRSGYNIPCNTKFGGIGIENTCYDCGANDNICPEDFKNVNCKIEDPDCS